ncbi:MAG: HAMP domain-containing histidine kinase [Bacteroidales bacterium]|nr:HAMP domain-containing histidine kinase [Bacteroidales bacterium]
MKKTKIQLVLLIITVVCLITLVGIQIAWILKEAERQENQFNHSVGMALKRIEDNLAKYMNCTYSGKCTSCVLLTNTLKQVANLDSIIKSDLRYYGIDLNYEYGIIDVKKENTNNPSRGTYFTNSLAEKMHQAGYELKINFPKKRDFIIAQIGLIFIFSIVLVVLVTVSFLLIYRYYSREKLLSDQIRDFVNNMTHEFKTPLTNIGFANSMLSKNALIANDPKLLSYTSIIRTEHYRLKDRVEELLRTSQSDSILSVYTEIVDLYKIIEDVVESYQVQIQECDGTVSLGRIGEDFSITANVDQLYIIIGNLIDNAIKYCTKQMIIKIVAKSFNDKLIIEVTDNGVGIPSEHLHGVFEKFYRIPQGDMHNIKGFGLGLFHVKTIVERMGGKISVSSSVGKGSTFTIEFHKNKV